MTEDDSSGDADNVVRLVFEEQQHAASTGESSESPRKVVTDEDLREAILAAAETDVEDEDFDEDDEYEDELDPDEPDPPALREALRKIEEIAKRVNDGDGRPPNLRRV